LVRVELSRSALAQDSAGLGDALNPRTWIVSRVDTGVTFTVLSVREVGSAVPASVFELLLLQQLWPYGVSHKVHAPLLRDENGWAAEAPLEATFDGCQAQVFTAQASAQALVDLAKPQLNDGLGGAVFNIGASGDYDVESGTSLLKKLFIRRLTTNPGEFFHLTQYGIGLRLKEPLNTPRLAQLRAEVERQLRLEPEVDNASASVRLGADGLLVVTLAARLRATGTEVKDVFSIPTVSL
jgi:phage baseplate assembly protein W